MLISEKEDKIVKKWANLISKHQKSTKFYNFLTVYNNEGATVATVLTSRLASTASPRYVTQFSLRFLPCSSLAASNQPRASFSLRTGDYGPSSSSGAHCSLLDIFISQKIRTLQSLDTFDRNLFSI